MTSARENTNGSGLPPVPSIPLTAESPAVIAGETSVGGLVRDATAHLSTLVRAEVELAKSEVAGEIKKGVKGSVYFIVALTVLLFSSFFFFFFGAELLDVWLPRWSAFLIVFGLMLVTAGLFAFLGYRKVKKLRAPQRTIDSARDTVAALRHRDAR
ncbi:phage holin family protein [Saccharothrix yanglingensis]|uniref:Superfamily III holin-X n=1 Tax=Saccharothrix yanglingensis TaxID=659496 RepID=A0ABU0WTY7_9PSEU|nr:phage holin family protein [Saccharothrix yanglingensis]MDQ2583313.1 hypothetical protein [Saccharothrix yanglingensis]